MVVVDGIGDGVTLTGWELSVATGNAMQRKEQGRDVQPGKGKRTRKGSWRESRGITGRDSSSHKEDQLVS